MVTTLAEMAIDLSLSIAEFRKTSTVPVGIARRTNLLRLIGESLRRALPQCLTVTKNGRLNQIARPDFFWETSCLTFKSKQLIDVDADCAVSSVVEHYLDTVGVGGSKPPPRTIFYFQCLMGF